MKQGDSQRVYRFSFHSFVFALAPTVLITHPPLASGTASRIRGAFLRTTNDSIKLKVSADHAWVTSNGSTLQFTPASWGLRERSRTICKPLDREERIEHDCVFPRILAGPPSITWPCLFITQKWACTCLFLRRLRSARTVICHPTSWGSHST